MNFFKKKKNTENLIKISLILEIKDLQEEVIKLQRDKIALLETNKKDKKEIRELKRKEEKNGRSKN
jgi:hypothetical protein